MTTNCVFSQNKGKEYSDISFEKEVQLNTYYDSEMGLYLTEEIKSSRSNLYLNGNKIGTLSSDEIVIGFSNNFLYTSKILEDEGKKISKYQTNEALPIKLLNEKTISHKEVITKISGGNLIITDDYEGYGTLVELFDNNLKSQITYYPFEKGYYSSEVIIENNIADVFCSSVSSSGQSVVKYAKFDISLNQMLTEKIISLPSIDLWVKKTYKIKDGFIFYCSSVQNSFTRAIIKADNSGNVLWYKNNLLPMFHKGVGIVESNIDDKLFLITGRKTILIVNSYSGEEYNTINLYEKVEPLIDSIAEIASITTDLKGNIIFFIGKLDWDKKNINTFSYRDNSIIIFNLEKEKFNSFKIEGEYKRPKLKVDGIQLLVLSQNKDLIIELNAINR
ncbi:MAG: hypothetical protein CVT95_06895 [Bacteroidetes bacterium HGW-Bacteroidetes-12]|nr:MAG: hypothetical protein CVT95_06895 [Bacteroidetes bacterium HGW-Bacteroidetes-12]